MNKRDNSKKKHLENEYRYWRSKTTRLIREANFFYSESIQTYKNNPKMLASVFKELNHQTKNVVNVTSIMSNNKTLTRDADIANIFNKHFTSVAEKYLNDTANKSHSPNLILLKEFIKQKLPKGNIFKIPLMTEQFICKFISKLDKNKATCIDNISAKILHLSSPVIAKHITDICNHSIHTSTFPTSWKKARVIPLHKRNSTENPENYRPISILT